jgi:hypothetical protein
MNNLRISILNLLLVISFQTIAQADSISVCKEIREMKISRAIKTPLILMSASAFAFTDTDFIGRADIFEDRNENFSSFRTHLDDYIQYAPIAGVITLNALGVRGQNKFSTQMWLLAKSELLMNAIVYPLKRITAVPRPDRRTHIVSFGSYCASLCGGYVYA